MVVLNKDFHTEKKLTPQRRTVFAHCISTPYMTTKEAAMYLRKSISWLLKQPDISYLQGNPNIYYKQDLDDWFERNKFKPRM